MLTWSDCHGDGAPPRTFELQLSFKSKVDMQVMWVNAFDWQVYAFGSGIEVENWRDYELSVVCTNEYGEDHGRDKIVVTRYWKLNLLKPNVRGCWCDRLTRGKYWEKSRLPRCFGFDIHLYY